MNGTEHDDPVDVVAHAIAAMERPLLLVFDCDGVLAPLTDHANDSVLTDGVGPALDRLSKTAGVRVAVLSGRSLDGLAQFDFSDSIIVAGSYGGERRGRSIQALTTEERALLSELDAIAVEAAKQAGPGAWVERKPTSVVIHVREADAELGADALEMARSASASLDGHECHEGSNVLEFMARPADKGRGLLGLIADIDPGGTAYFGDDVPDEDAFAVLGTSDVSVKVGDGASVAGQRLPTPDAVAQLIDRLCGLLDADSEFVLSEE